MMTEATFCHASLISPRTCCFCAFSIVDLLERGPLATPEAPRDPLVSAGLIGCLLLRRLCARACYASTPALNGVGSILTPGPCVVEIVIDFMYVPFAVAGLSFIRISCS